ncbi:hypothetical protein SLEP1_g13288 [Rubroshorea leprosula]|uniref:Uncharacterized protein n=1 Tax=Rubroshorea leprosula TaxID=152421 RepID=A0AAV5IRR5_9ROSI|nr:hypothetical protein SLEP1_g13288 [Rubroshorea leprosula]
MFSSLDVSKSSHSPSSSSSSISSQPNGNQDDPTCTTSRDPLHISGGPVMRVRAKKMQEALNGLIEQIWVDNNMHK